MISDIEIDFKTPSNFLFLEKTFDRLAHTGEICEVYGGALRDQLLGVKEVDIDIKVTQRLYIAFVREMKRQFRIISRRIATSEEIHKYTHEIIVIDTPAQKGLILDITFFDDDEENQIVDFTVNNLKQSLIGPNKGKLLVRVYNSYLLKSKSDMSYVEWLSECIRDVFTKRLKCIYDIKYDTENVRDFVKWHSRTFENRYKRLEKMKAKEAFKNSKVEYLTDFKFDKNITYGEVDISDIVKEDNCPICIISWDEIPTRIITFTCRHTFCSKCLEKHMIIHNHNFCPICKKIVSRYLM